MTKKEITEVYQGLIITEEEKHKIMLEECVRDILYHQPSSTYPGYDMYLIIYKDSTFATCFMEHNNVSRETI